MSPKREIFDLLILYGSETGNCEDLAKRIGRQAIDRSVRVQVMECDEYNVSELIDQKLVLFVCSTTGIGEEPNNMKKFWKFIRRKDLPKDSMSSVYVSVIGLGDSSYERYNFVAKKLYKRLIDLGANPLTQLVLGDDQHECGPNAVIEPWLQHFWTEVSSVFSIDFDLIQGSPQMLASSYAVNFTNVSEHKSMNLSEKSKSNANKFDKNDPYFAEMLLNERITTEDHFQDVRHIKLKIEKSKLNYGLGDVCYIKPQNSEENVEKFLSLLNLDRNIMFSLEKHEHNWMSPSSYYNNLPKPCSVATLVTEYMDIQSIPKRSFFELLHLFSQNDLEKQKLKDFSEIHDLEDLYEYCNRPKRTIIEVLSDFPNTTPHIPFEYLFDLIPALNPRPFSIASSSAVNPTEIDLLVAVVNYRTRLKEPRLGLCSNWLANQLPSKANKIPIYIGKGSFRIAPDPVPYIMIGPGTGVAAFRAFISERAHRGVANNYLFFGCRYRKHDFYFEEEWNQLERDQLLENFVAFSRDTEQKVYVQHILWQQKERVFKLISQNNAYIYVSGNSKQMPQQIRQTICDILRDQSKQDLTDEEVQRIVNNFEIRGRLQYECWS